LVNAGEAVGMVSFPMKNDTNYWASQTSLSRFMQKASARSAHTFGLQPLKKRVRYNNPNVSTWGNFYAISLFVI